MQKLQHIFYHGTSSLYLSSIKKHGLAGINPNIRYDLLELLSYLYSECERRISDNVNYIDIKQATQAMVQQRFLKFDDGPYRGIHNFRHENIYLAYSEQKAVCYAVCNEYGSEILTRIVMLFRLLTDAESNFKIPKSLDDLDIPTISKTKAFPILVEVADIDLNVLRYEDGSSAENILYHLLYAKYAYTDETFHYLSQKHSFELCMPIPAAKLKFHTVIPTGNIYRPEDFTYRLQLLV